ncbi:MAG: c-type cytochrome [Gemmatimonadaceae bacterium]
MTRAGAGSTSGTRSTRRPRRRALAVIALGCLTGCQPPGDAGSGRGSVAKAAALPTRLEIGRPAMPQEVAAWNVDVNPKGEGLPAGSGNAIAGATVYATKCASCHGAKGEGGAPPNARLVGREPRDFSFATSTSAVKTVGNYWPYATTLYDYIRRAMPQNAPGSLTPDETYAVIAWLLAENEIIPRNQVLDANALPQVVMPSRDRFVRDDRTGGAGFR